MAPFVMIPDLGSSNRHPSRYLAAEGPTPRFLIWPGSATADQEPQVIHRRSDGMHVLIGGGGMTTMNLRAGNAGQDEADYFVRVRFGPGRIFRSRPQVFCFLADAGAVAVQAREVCEDGFVLALSAKSTLGQRRLGYGWVAFGAPADEPVREEQSHDERA